MTHVCSLRIISASTIGPVIQRKQGTIEFDREIKDTNSTEMEQFKQGKIEADPQITWISHLTGIINRKDDVNFE
jgi:hypothetical protein